MVAPLTARQIRDRLLKREGSVVETCRQALGVVDALDPRLHAFLYVASEAALARAQQLDDLLARDSSAAAAMPLLGVPVAIKDNLCVEDMPTTAGSKILEGFRPPYTATCVSRLQAAGAIVLGKSNCDEFAMGSSTEYSAFGPTRNPWALDRAPGGSSGGSAVAVAAAMTPIALGSDTGGSIRQPAAFCGVVGLKPTYGRVSRYGLIAFASSLDQVGPLARTADDAARTLQAMAGGDAADATCSGRAVPDYLASLDGDLRSVTIGVPRRMLEDGLDEEMRHAFDEALSVLCARGARLVDIELPHAAYGIPVYYLVATAEASANLARYDGVRFGLREAGTQGVEDMFERTRARGFGPEVKRRIMLGTYALSAGYYDAYYLKAQQVRTLIRRDFETAFSRCDAVATPTTPAPAFRLGERLNDPLQMYLADIFTVAAPLAGLPAISMPCGLTRARLPLGLQLVGRPFDEATLLRTADAFERETSWWRETPDSPPPGH